jgi:hypothetical protein
MMTLLLTLAISIFQGPVKADSLKLSDPKSVATITLDKDVVRRLAWNADGTELYVQTAELKVDALPKTAFHSVINLAAGKIQRIDAEPKWAEDYHEWKSWKSAPGDDAFMIELATEQRRNSATALPMAGEMARGGGVDPATTGASVESVMAVAQQSQSGTANIMRLKGQTVGEWLNQPIVPGQTFGWGPAGSGVIAYADVQNRQLILMDKNGQRQKIGGTKGVWTPSFSADFTKLAWIEIKGKKATVYVADISK